MNAPRSSRLFVALGLAASATLFALVGQKALAPVRFWFYDTGFSGRPTHKPADIVVLGIDEPFMEGRHAYLAPRDRLATLISNVASGQPKAIALDVWLDSRIDDRQNGDASLKAALRFAKKQGVPVILADVPPQQDEFSDDSMSGQTAHSSVISYFAHEARTGSIILNLDDDRHLRRHSIETPDSPSLPLQMARLGGGKADWWPPADAPIAFCGAPQTIETQSAVDFLQPELAPLLAGKLVFIGATAPRLRDFQQTPYSHNGAKPMYGVEILAQMTDSLRRGAPLRSDTTSAARLFDFSLVFGAAFLVALAGLRGNGVGIVSALCVLLLAIVSAILSIQNGGPFWGFRFHDPTPFLLAVPLALMGSIGWRSYTTARELRLVRDSFGAYVGAEVLEALGGKMPELGGETRQISVLFCDIRGYSALAESMESDPKALLDELNAHFAPLVAALKKRGAYVDNYVGDLVMALFGAPVSSGQFRSDVRAATLAALDFVQIIEERNHQRRAAGLIPIEVGIGVHCGIAVVGNMGSSDPKSGGKIHYTAIGDVVNVASRVESATRAQDVPLLVTREVVDALGDSPDLPAWNRIGEIAVKGRSAPVEVFKIA